MKYIAYRTDDGKNAGKIRFYCKALEVSRQAFYDYLKRKNKIQTYKELSDFYDYSMKLLNQDNH